MVVSSVERYAILRVATVYQHIQHFQARVGLIFPVLLIAVQILCIFEGKYFYYVPGEMHI